MHKTNVELKFLDRNVSEWLKDDYGKSWGPIWVKRKEQIDTFQEAGAKILGEIEKYYNQPHDSIDKMA